ISRPPTNPKITFARFVDNSSTSDYNALQLQFHRRLSHGLQVQASYSWAHSIDTGSASSGQLQSNRSMPGSDANRGSSDFDIRNAFSTGIAYEVPAPVQNPVMKAVLRGWSLQNAIQIRSAPPVNVSDVLFSSSTLTNGFLVDIRPDLVPGQPLYLFGAQFPGEKAINPAAFTDPPFNPITFSPLRQGDVPRNSFRGFGAAQWDLAVHRD